MRNRQWRGAARAAIARALDGVTATDETEIRRILFAAYPFGAREFTPYRVWCDEGRAAIERRAGGVTLRRKPSRRDLDKLERWNRAAYTGSKDNA